MKASASSEGKLLFSMDSLTPPSFALYVMSDFGTWVKQRLYRRAEVEGFMQGNINKARMGGPR